MRISQVLILSYVHEVLCCQHLYSIVMTMEEDPETIGYMKISVEALQVLRTVKNNKTAS